MSRTNKRAAICGRCGVIVPTGQGAIRYWNGAARRHAPKYAIRSAFGVLNACHCVKCDVDRVGNPM
jgi:hypothetical protein